MSDDRFRLEAATEADLPLILRFIKELAAYEQLAQDVVATEDGLRQSLFGPHPAAEAVIAYAGDEPAGFAIYFQTFSTFLGKPGLYLEDLYVTPAWRGRGIGRRLLAHVARVAVERGYGRMEWSVLDWNELALGVYRNDWRAADGRMDGPAPHRRRAHASARQPRAPIAAAPPTVSPVTGIASGPGAISASGSSTKRRSRNPGCGTADRARR